MVVLQYGASILSPSLIAELDDAVVGAVVVLRNPRGRTDDEDPIPGLSHASLVVLNDNRGYSAAVNAGRAHPNVRDRRFHLILTHDVELSPGCIASLASTLQCDESIAIAGPVLADAFPVGDHAQVGGTIGRFGLVRHRTRPWPPDGAVADTPVEEDVDWIDGAVMMLRANVVPTFDERFFLYVEEVAVCMAVRPAHRVVVATQAVASQVSGATLRPGAHGYLLVRNALLLDRTQGHGRSRGLIRSTLMTGAQGKRLVTGEGPGRRHHLRQAIGMVWGMFDGMRNRGGPPPATLRKWGDVTVD